MRAELISLRSRAEGKQSSERLTTSSLWRNTSTLESLISFSRWGSEWILSVCFLKTWLSLSVFPGEQSTAERSRCLSRPLVVIGWAVIYHERRREVTGQRPQSPGGLFNHREWALIPPLNTKFELLPEFHAPCSYTINSLQFAAGCQIQSVNSAACYHYATLLLNRSNTNSNFHLNIQKLMMFTTITKFDF